MENKKLGLDLDVTHSARIEFFADEFSGVVLTFSVFAILSIIFVVVSMRDKSQQFHVSALRNLK